MTIDLVFAILILGHVLGDFYVQTDPVARNKDNSLKLFTLHVLLYSACMGIILAAAIPCSKNLIYLWLSSSLLHLSIDLIKKAAKKYVKKEAVSKFLNNHSLVLDQLLHLLTLAGAWYIWGTSLTVRPYIEQDIYNIPGKPVLLLLCFLCVLRPVGILIGKGELWDFKHHNLQPDDSVQNAGRMIGYLERTIVLFFLIYQQYGAIAFVLTAKSVARFKDIENSKKMAEYYLIGTLLSVVSVFISAFLLGLCSAT